MLVRRRKEGNREWNSRGSWNPCSSCHQRKGAVEGCDKDRLNDILNFEVVGEGGNVLGGGYEIEGGGGGVIGRI